MLQLLWWHKEHERKKKHVEERTWCWQCNATDKKKKEQWKKACCECAAKQKYPITSIKSQISSFHLPERSQIDRQREYSTWTFFFLCETCSGYICPDYSKFKIRTKNIAYKEVCVVYQYVALTVTQLWSPLWFSKIFSFFFSILLCDYHNDMIISSTLHTRKSV